AIRRGHEVDARGDRVAARARRAARHAMDRAAERRGARAVSPPRIPRDDGRDDAGAGALASRPPAAEKAPGLEVHAEGGPGGAQRAADHAPVTLRDSFERLAHVRGELEAAVPAERVPLGLLAIAVRAAPPPGQPGDGGRRHHNPSLPTCKDKRPGATGLSRCTCFCAAYSTRTCERPSSWLRSSRRPPHRPSRCTAPPSPKARACRTTRCSTDSIAMARTSRPRPVGKIRRPERRARG